MEENEEVQAENSSRPKVDWRALVSAFMVLDWKDPRKIGTVVVLVILLLSPLFLFGGGGSPAPSQKEGEMAGNAPISAPAIVYVPLASSSKSGEFMATINETDKILTFSAVLGLEKAELQIDVEQSMAPLLSEILRFLSDKSKADILEMIRDEDGRERSRLLQRMNNVLSSRGVDLNTKGMVVSISFTRYFFPPL